MKLNLGCGPDLRKGYLNIDIYPPKKSRRGESIDGFEFKQSDVSDLSWIKTDSVDEIIAKDILDHIHWKHLSMSFAEWNRVLKSGGCLYIREAPDFERDAMRYFNSERDIKEWERLQGWVDRLAYQEDRLRSKNLLDFPRLKKMLEEQNFVIQKHWHDGEGLNIDCQKS